MLAYILRRLLLIIPTLFGILLINFIIIQAAPGGPVEQMIAKLEGFDAAAGGATGRISGGGSEVAASSSSYRGAQGLDPELIKDIEKLYGFDKPAPERFWIMISNYLKLDFGESFFRDAKVTDLIIEKMPVSISLGLWSTLIMYLVSIPLGVAKAVRHGSAFDVWTSTAIVVGYAVPAFLFAILLIVVFAGGSYLDWFPLRGLTSNNFDELSTWGKIVDYFHHLALPITALVIGNSDYKTAPLPNPRNDSRSMSLSRVSLEICTHSFSRNSSILLFSISLFLSITIFVTVISIAPIVAIITLFQHIIHIHTSKKIFNSKLNN